MKKTYINPAMKVIEIKHRQQLLAGSRNAKINGSQGNEYALSSDFDDFDDFDE